MEIEKHLREYAIDIQDYRDLILALYQAAPKDIESHLDKKVDERGYSCAQTTVSRDFGDISIVAEDRGSVYIVWVKKTQEGGGMECVLVFEEFPWDQLLSHGERSPLCY